MPAQWSASASVAASWYLERARPEVAILLLQLSAGRRRQPAPPPTVVNVRARAAQGRCASESRSQCDRSAACGHR
eukprot:3730564-Prymnesium_polylepis.1